jgi:hypothetical protein
MGDGGTHWIPKTTRKHFVIGVPILSSMNYEYQMFNVKCVEFNVQDPAGKEVILGISRNQN